MRRSPALYHATSTLLWMPFLTVSPAVLTPKQLQEQLELRLCSKHCWFCTICLGTAHWCVHEPCCRHLLWWLWDLPGRQSLHGAQRLLHCWRASSCAASAAVQAAAQVLSLKHRYGAPATGSCTTHAPAGDPNFAGVKWHVDLNGNEFPFSRGCSFYEVGLLGSYISAAAQVCCSQHWTSAWALQKAAWSFRNRVGCWSCCALLKLEYA